MALKRKFGKMEKEKINEKLKQLERAIYPSLSFGEIAFYTFSWIIVHGYAWYLVYKLSRKFYPALVSNGIISTTQLNAYLPFEADYSDWEWKVFSANLAYSIPWIAFHFVTSQILRLINRHILPIFNIMLSAIYLEQIIGIKPLMWMMCQIFMFFAVHFLASPVLVWIVALLFLFAEKEWSGPLNVANEFFLQDVNEVEHYIFTVAWAWLNLRCISFCLDRIWMEVSPLSKLKMDNFIRMLAYCFYIPVNISGPVILFRDFHKGFNKQYEKWSLNRMINFSMQVLRFSVWLLSGHLIIHFFYFSSFTYNMDILTSLDVWTLAGVGLSVAGFFNIKYTVFYGWSRPFVVADGIDMAPLPPKCVYRIHLYSDMWRYFDRGLYLFLKTYIYLPVAGYLEGMSMKIVGSLATFGFIYLWHGASYHVMLWSLFNYFAVITELIARSIGTHPTYANMENKYLSTRGKRRLHALLAAPLYVGSVLANFYFFMGADIGHYFVQKILWSWPIETPIVLLLSYMGNQVSIEVKNWELRKHMDDFTKVKDH